MMWRANQNERDLSDVQQLGPASLTLLLFERGLTSAPATERHSSSIDN